MRSWEREAQLALTMCVCVCDEMMGENTECSVNARRSWGRKDGEQLIKPDVKSIGINFKGF